MRYSNDTLDDIVLYSYNLDLLKSSATLFMYATFDRSTFCNGSLLPAIAHGRGHKGSPSIDDFFFMNSAKASKGDLLKYVGLRVVIGKCAFGTKLQFCRGLRP